MTDSPTYSAVVIRYMRDPIYVQNPIGMPPMSKMFARWFDVPTTTEMFEYGDFTGDPRHILAIADNQPLPTKAGEPI